MFFSTNIDFDGTIGNKTFINLQRIFYLDTVSYTHLDVYKRQQISFLLHRHLPPKAARTTSEVPPACREKFLRLPPDTCGTPENPEAVSYTHLNIFPI